MKVTFQISYDAGKLAKEMPKIIKEFLGNSATAFEIGSKEAIERGDFTPISDFTKEVRKKGLSPNAKNKKTTSTKPLRHTDRLLKSIKAFPKSKMLKFNEYGKHHLGKGAVFATGVHDLDDFKRESGTAYKIKPNSFTKFIKARHRWKKDYLAGKPVPTRFWLKYDEQTGETGLKMFKSKMRKAFRKKSLGFFI